MEFRSSKSNWKEITGPFKFLNYSTTFYDLFVSRAPMMALHPNSAIFLTVYFPIPEFPPVTTTIWFDRSFWILHLPPAKNFLMRKSTIIATAISIKAMLFIFFIYQFNEYIVFYINSIILNFFIDQIYKKRSNIVFIIRSFALLSGILEQIP